MTCCHTITTKTVLVYFWYIVKVEKIIKKHTMKQIKNKKINLRMLKEIDDFFNGVFEYKIKKPKLTTSSFSNKFINKQKK